MGRERRKKKTETDGTFHRHAYSTTITALRVATHWTYVEWNINVRVLGLVPSGNRENVKHRPHIDRSLLQTATRRIFIGDAPAAGDASEWLEAFTLRFIWTLHFDRHEYDPDSLWSPVYTSRVVPFHVWQQIYGFYWFRLDFFFAAHCCSIAMHADYALIHDSVGAHSFIIITTAVCGGSEVCRVVWHRQREVIKLVAVVVAVGTARLSHSLSHQIF